MRKHFTKRDLICEWQDEDEQYYDDMLCDLKTYLDKINPAGYWRVSVKNFGWRSLDGKKVLQTNTAREFLQSILPNCECSFNIYKNGKRGIALQNYHHDGPTGNEWYYIYPITEKEFEDDNS